VRYEQKRDKSVAMLKECCGYHSFHSSCTGLQNMSEKGDSPLMKQFCLVVKRANYHFYLVDKDHNELI